MSFKDILWHKDDNPSLNEIETRRQFYFGTASAPVSGINNTVANSTFLEEHISKLDQEKFIYRVYSYGNGDTLAQDWHENKEREDYLRLGIESFDIFD